MGIIIGIDLRKSLNMTVFVCLLVCAIVSIFFFQTGVDRYKKEEKTQIEFINIEERLVDRYFNYRVYGIYGLRTLLVPCPLSATAYKSASFKELQGYMDNGVRLDSQKPETPEVIFESSGGFFDFSNFIFIAGTAIALFFGWWAFGNKEYLKFLKSFTSKGFLYAAMFISKAIILSIGLLIIFIMGLIIFYLNGVNLNVMDILYFAILFLTSLFLVILFLSIGMALGIINKRLMGLTICAAIFGFFVLLLPDILSIQADKAMNSYNRYEFEEKKVKILMEFEKLAYSKSQRCKTIEEKFESDKEMAERYLEKEVKEIEALELENLEMVEESIDKFHLWSSIFPTTFYKSVNNEVSSKGYNSYLIFIKKNQSNQSDFFKWYKEKVYDNPYDKVVPFLKKGENLIKGNPSLPGNFLFGISVTFGLNLIFLFYGLFEYIRYVDLDVPEGIESLTVHIKTVPLNYFHSRDPRVWNYIYLIFSGKVPNVITIDGKKQTKLDFIYLPHPDYLPGDLKKTLLRFLGINKAEAKNWPMWQVLVFYGISTGKIILSGGLLSGLSDIDIGKLKSFIREEKAVLIEIGKDRYIYRQAENKMFWNIDKSIDQATWYNAIRETDPGPN